MRMLLGDSFNFTLVEFKVNQMGITAKALLLSVLALAGLNAKNNGEISYSESESREVLSTLAGPQILEIMDASKTRELNTNEAQILQSLQEKGAQILVAGPEPMY